MGCPDRQGATITVTLCRIRFSDIAKQRPSEQKRQLNRLK